MPAPFTNIDKRFDIFSIVMKIRPNILKDHSDFEIIKVHIIVIIMNYISVKLVPFPFIQKVRRK